MIDLENPKWEDIKKYLKRAGKEILAVAEAAFETWRDPETPDSIKLALAGGLAYLILPTDAIPDFLPMGFTDDLTLLSGLIVLAGTIGKKHLAECRIKRGLDHQGID